MSKHLWKTSQRYVAYLQEQLNKVEGLNRWKAILIIPLKMQREFVNINFPEPKGASLLVCHLFTGPESCTLTLNRPRLDPPGQSALTTTSDPHRTILPCVHIWHTTFSKTKPFFLLKVKTNQIHLTLFLQECFSGGQGTVTHFGVLQKFYSSGDLRRQREKT